MNENPTPTPPEQNPSSEPVLPTSRRELRAESGAADARPVPPTPQGDAPSIPEPAAPAVPGPTAPAYPGAPASGGYPAAPVPNPAPQPGLVPPATAPAAPTEPEFGPANPPIDTPGTLDEGTFDRIREPRREGLALDGTWHQISKKYVVSQVVQDVFWLAVVLIAATVVTVATGEPWAFIPAGIISLFIIASLVILPRQAKALGYMLRGDDVVFRKGILWQRMIAVPYGRMQLIDITHGPLDRVFGVSKLKMVTAAASTGVEIPGLTTAGAEALRDTLIEVAETRRTGL
ncbi:MAG TPA: PH domain-containing protein [Microbacterium sp.]|nr:PH domain-containing protein [Microbacterium sp.]